MEKTIHLVRHAEGYHNVQGEILLQLLDLRSILQQGRWRRLRFHHLVRIVCCFWRMLCTKLMNSVVAPHKSTKTTAPYEHLDASLTATGWKQVAERRKDVAKVAKDKVELVVVSPLKRTLQTAAGVFGGGEVRPGEALPPLMAGKVGRCPQPAISSAGCPPFLANELCRERISNAPCDNRSRISECQKQFPAIDFSEVDGEEDALWKATSCESQEELSARVKAFVEWLWSRPEKGIAVVSHQGFLFEMLRLFGGANVDGSRFENCELRTVKMRSTDGIMFD